MSNIMLNWISGGGKIGLLFLVIEICLFTLAMFKKDIKSAVKLIITAYWFALANIGSLVFFSAFGLGGNLLEKHVLRMFMTIAIGTSIPCIMSFCISIRYRKDMTIFLGCYTYIATLGLYVGYLIILIAMLTHSTLYPRTGNHSSGIIDGAKTVIFRAGVSC